MSVWLLEIVDLGEARYRLTFRDRWMSETNVVLEHRARRGFVISGQFGDFFRGRGSGNEALKAVTRFMKGEPVPLPIWIEDDHFEAWGR